MSMAFLGVAETFVSDVRMADIGVAETLFQILG